MNATRFASHRALTETLQLNICQGRALFPAFGTFRAGVSGSGQGRTLFSGGANFGLFKASASSSYNFRLGICGPAWAGSFIVRQEAGGSTGQQLVLTREDSWSGGFFAGATLFFGVSVGVTVFCGISISCRRWSCSVSWRYCNAFSFNVGVNIDVVALMAQLADFDTNWGVPGYGQSIDMTDDGGDILNKTGWSDTINPKFTVSFNLLNLIKPVKAFNDAAGKWGTGVNLGPYFSVVFPISFRVTRFGRNLGGDWKQYTVGNRVGDNLPLTVADSGLANPGSNRARVEFQWRISTTFEIGITAGFSLLWVIGFSISVGFPIGNLIRGLRRGGYTTSTILTSTAGSSGLGAVISGLPAGDDCGCDDPMIAQTHPQFTFAELEPQSA